jgi:ATP-dependent Clp protease adapter protein ClpS
MRIIECRDPARAYGCVFSVVETLRKMYEDMGKELERYDVTVTDDVRTVMRYLDEVLVDCFVVEDADVYR